MLKSISRYLDEVRDHLKLDGASESEVIRELESHIEDRLSEMKESGMSDEDATNVCLKLLGSAKLVAHRLYEAHSQGSWRQAIMGSLPHLLFALLFVLNWWQGVGWLVIMLGFILGTTLYGWLHGRPVWLFPWLGYLLVPVIGAGLLLFYLPRGWSWLAIVAYIPLAFWLIGIVAVQTVRRDWLYGALMLQPVPIVIAWCLVGARGTWFLGLDPNQLSELANWIGLSFIGLAATAIAFIRIRQRWFKTSILLISGISILTMIAFYAGPALAFPTYLLLVVLMAGLLLSMALLDKRVRRKEISHIYENQPEIVNAKTGHVG
jgi:hypothetical protein